MTKISSSDRSALTRLASSLPAGDENRKAILASLAKTSAGASPRFMREVEDLILAADEDDLGHIEKFIAIRRNQLRSGEFRQTQPYDHR